MSAHEMRRSAAVRYYPCECGLGFGEEGIKCGFCGKRLKVTEEYFETNREITNWSLWLMRHMPNYVKRKRYTIWHDGRLIYALYGLFKSLIILARSPNGSVMRFRDEEIARKEGDDIILLQNITMGDELRFPIPQALLRMPVESTRIVYKAPAVTE